MTSGRAERPPRALAAYSGRAGVPGRRQAAVNPVLYQISASGATPDQAEAANVVDGL